MWDKALGVIGAAASLAAVLFAIGVATVWLRFQVAGYASWAVIQHQPQLGMIALGLRGLAAVAGLVVVMVLLSAALVAPLHFWARHKVPLKADDPIARATRPGDIARYELRLRQLVAWPSRLVCIALLLVALSRTWATVAAVLIFIASIKAAGYFLGRGRPAWDDVTSLSVGRSVILVAAASTAAVMWQVSPVIHSGSVIISPPLQTSGLASECNDTAPEVSQSLSDRAIPYFGQDGSYVYVDDIRCFSMGYFQRSQRVEQVSLKGLTLSFPPGDLSLCAAPESPARFLWRNVKAAATIVWSGPEVSRNQPHQVAPDLCRPE
jgi:hypothetical protein